MLQEVLAIGHHGIKSGEVEFTTFHDGSINRGTGIGYETAPRANMVSWG
jgi:hypothetical protein